MFIRPDLQEGEEVITNAITDVPGQSPDTKRILRTANQVVSNIRRGTAGIWDKDSLRVATPAYALDTGKVVPGHSAVIGRRLQKAPPQG